MNTLRLSILAFLLLFFNCSFSAELLNIKDTSEKKNIAIVIPNVLPVHPLVEYSTRKLINSKSQPDKFSFKISLSNGNLWLPYATTYYPQNKFDIDSLNGMPWHYRKMDKANIEATEEHLHIDGLFRALNTQLNFGIKFKHELVVNLRMLYMEKGRKPFTYFNSDDFIEKFHSNVVRDEDPFARKLYAFDQAKLYYKQTDGTILTYENRKIVLPGVDFSHYYYFEKPTFVSLNVGQHLGINTTQFNFSADYGVSATLLKSNNLRKNRELNIAGGAILFYHQIIKSKKASHFYAQPLNFMTQGTIEYKWQSNKTKNYNSVAVDFYLQSTYNRKYNEKNYNSAIIDRNLNFSQGHVTSTHMFTSAQTWSLIYSHYFEKSILSIYMQEDLKVNNSPDTQTGVSFKYILE